MTVTPGGRVVFDLSSSARWTGPPAGIVRAQRELAHWARAHLPGAVFAFFDPTTKAYRAIVPRYIDAFVAGTASLNAWDLPDATGRRKRRSDWVPAPLYAAVQGRRTLLRLLERVRLTSGRPGLVRLADWAQRVLMTARYRPAMLNDDGTRCDFVTADLALADPVAFVASDALVCTGYGWSHSNIAEIARLKVERGLRLAILCYDIIPLQFPQWFKPRDVDDMRDYWRGGFAAADLVVVNSRSVAADARRYCEEHRIALGRVTICPLGADPVAMRSSPNSPLPDGLEEGRYGLFVSTIEPRKGHELLHRVWLRLLAEGLPQARGFRLVFVGRPGWMMEAFDRTLRDEAHLDGSLVVLPHVSDEMLDTLYRRAAFCLYPSLYEGYGLPVIEAFARGKAVLASSGGALPELAADFSPCLDPRDEDAWCDMLRSWIEHPARRAPFEVAIRQRFRHPSWNEAAATFFREVSEALGSSIGG